MRGSPLFSKDFKIRTLTILLFLPLFLLLLLLNRITMVGLFLVIAFLAFREYLSIALGKEEWPPLLLALGALVWIYLLPWIPEKARIPGWYTLSLALLGWVLQDVEKCLERVSFFFFGVFYCFVLPFFWVRTGLEFSPRLLLFFALLVWVNDISAYLFGVRWGSHKVLPAISPGKSWEGFLGGAGSAFLGSILLSYVFGLPLLWCCLCGATLPPLAFLGDIFESALKRRRGVKDSGALLPGHGGILDRFDAFFAVGPLVYFLASLGRG
ncbi:MAG: phosphatidate cytidylyltransferase [Candidatus Caldatribacterium sp.]|nr:phosphatidate cytidylyltransferase [Candidatus Caldatribacterium sp.]